VLRQITPADPASPDSVEVVTQQAGQVRTVARVSAPVVSDFVSS
jgi:hypothetical protein